MFLVSDGMLTAQILQSLIHTEKVILSICLNRAKKKNLINKKDRLNRRPFLMVMMVNGIFFFMLGRPEKE